MFYSGIADEAGGPIASQIRAHEELGWSHIELRTVDGENITSLSDDAFDGISAALSEAGLHVSCLGSAIGNWARPITIDPKVDREDLARAIPRMQTLNCPFIRVMSYPNDPDRPVSESDWRDEAITRMKYLAQMAEDGGVTLVHENCSGWGGLSPENGALLLESVDSPALKAVFDTGNPVTYGQDSWAYYQSMRNDIVYVHVKDAIRREGEDEYTFCGEGEGCVRKIVADLLGRGYQGGLSIEPHLAAVIHTGERAQEEETLYQSYTEYGRRLMAMVAELKAEQATKAPTGA